MLSLMKNRILPYGLKNLDVKIDLYHFMQMLNKVRMMSTNALTESKDTNRTSSSCMVAETLKDLCKENAEHFKKDDSENGQRLYLAFQGKPIMCQSYCVMQQLNHIKENKSFIYNPSNPFLFQD